MGIDGSTHCDNRKKCRVKKGHEVGFPTLVSRNALEHWSPGASAFAIGSRRASRLGWGMIFREKLIASVSSASGDLFVFKCCCQHLTLFQHLHIGEIIVGRHTHEIQKARTTS
jgi:hypothetical protein